MRASRYLNHKIFVTPNYFEKILLMDLEYAPITHLYSIEYLKETRQRVVAAYTNLYVAITTGNNCAIDSKDVACLMSCNADAFRCIPCAEKLRTSIELPVITLIPYSLNYSVKDVLVKAPLDAASQLFCIEISFPTLYENHKGERVRSLSNNKNGTLFKEIVRSLRRNTRCITFNKLNGKEAMMLRVNVDDGVLAKFKSHHSIEIS